MPKKQDKEKVEFQERINKMQSVDSNIKRMLNDNDASIIGSPRGVELNTIFNKFDEMIKKDTYNVVQSKSASQSTYDYLTNVLLSDRGHVQLNPVNGKTKQEQQAYRRSQMEKIFAATDMNATSMFLNGSSDVFHICDEVDSVCAYMYQLNEAILVLRDNILNIEQSTKDFPFEITFDTSDGAIEYVKTVKDALNDTKFKRLLNDHLVPKTLKYGRYYNMIIPYKDIGVELLSAEKNGTHSVFNIPVYEAYVKESLENKDAVDNSGLSSVIENADVLLESLYKEPTDEVLELFGEKDSYKKIIIENLKNLQYNDDPNVPPNVTGIAESAFGKMNDEMKQMVADAIRNNNNKFNATVNPYSNMGRKPREEDKSIFDGTIDPSKMDDVPGCFIKVLDPRVLVPIKIFDYVIGYYYFENYDYARMGTSVTDVLSNQINFKQNNLIVNNIVSSILKNLKYGDVLNGDDDFKALVLNSVFYAERLNNPIRIKFISTEYVVEYKTNCDEEDNGQPVLLQSLIYARLYISMLFFLYNAIITKSTDSEYYYLSEGPISQSYEDQVADTIEQMRNSNIDISQVLAGNLLHGNRAINKRYFFPKGTDDKRLLDIDIVSGQSIDTHNDFLTDLRKMAIGSTGVPSVAIDYMDEVEFATILKMSNTKTLGRSNNIQLDLNPSITESVKRIVMFNRPNAIPENILNTLKCTLIPSNKVNIDISQDELNNVVSTAEMMVSTYYKGDNTEAGPLIPYIKEEAQKRLVIQMASTLPWGELESMADDILIEARRRMEEDKLKNDDSE